MRETLRYYTLENILGSKDMETREKTVMIFQMDQELTLEMNVLQRLILFAITSKTKRKVE